MEASARPRHRGHGMKIDMEPLDRTCAGDLDACARLMSTSEPWITLGRSEDQSREILRDPNREVTVARVDGGIVGFSIVQMKGPFTGYLQSLLIGPGWRNRGIGAELLRQAEERVFRDTPNVFVCVSSFNPRARAFYERSGYEEIGEIKEYIVPGHSEILLRKTRGPLSEFKRNWGL